MLSKLKKLVIPLSLCLFTGCSLFNSKLPDPPPSTMEFEKAIIVAEQNIATGIEAQIQLLSPIEDEQVKKALLIAKSLQDIYGIPPYAPDLSESNILALAQTISDTGIVLHQSRTQLLQGYTEYNNSLLKGNLKGSSSYFTNVFKLAILIILIIMSIVITVYARISYGGTVSTAIASISAVVVGSATFFLWFKFIMLILGIIVFLGLIYGAYMLIKEALAKKEIIEGVQKAKDFMENETREAFGNVLEKELSDPTKNSIKRIKKTSTEV